MNIKLIKEREAPLLARKRLSFEIDYSGSKTPSKDDVKKTVASLQKIKEDLVAVRHIYPRFGSSKAKIIVHIYKTLKDLKRYEPKIKKKEKKAEGAPAEAPKEKPKEEKKEEKPKEEKKEEAPKEEKAEEKVNAKEESKEQKAK